MQQSTPPTSNKLSFYALRGAAGLSALLAAAAAITPALAHEPVHDHHEPDWEDHGHDHGDRHGYPQRGYWSPVFNAGLSFGGERLATVEVDTAFNGIEEEDIRAGELFMFGGGLLFTERNFQLQATFNYHVDGIFGENGDASFTRWPLELLAFTTTPRWRVGGGVSYHIDPEVEIDIDFQPREKAKFENAAGIVFQADYRFNENLSLGLRHMAIDYEVEGNDNEVDGDNTGLIFTVNF